MKKILATTLVAVLVPLAGSTAFAAEPEELVGAAAAMIREGRTVEAYKTLKKGLDLLGPRAPLTVLRSMLIKDDPAATGVYDPRGSNRYLQGERIVVYGEVIGFATIAEEGRQRVSLGFDYTLTGAEGEIYAGKREFGTWEQESRDPITETYFYLSYEFTGLEPGIYDLETKIRDTVSKKETTLVIPVEIIANPSLQDGPAGEVEP